MFWLPARIRPITVSRFSGAVNICPINPYMGCFSSAEARRANAIKLLKVKCRRLTIMIASLP
jgi:hypothetical protein